MHKRGHSCEDEHEQGAHEVGNHMAVEKPKDTDTHIADRKPERPDRKRQRAIPQCQHQYGTQQNCLNEEHLRLRQFAQKIFR